MVPVILIIAGVLNYLLFLIWKRWKPIKSDDSTGTEVSPRQDRITRERLDKGTEMFFGQPAVYPQELVNVLRKALADIPLVEAAYLCWVHIPGSDERPHIIVGFKLMNGSLPEVMFSLRQRVQNLPNADGIVDFAEIKDDKLSDYLLTQTKPFFERSSPIAF
jgi:hypothetical protein